MDPSQFTNQIALFSQVEQLVATNENLGELKTLNENLVKLVGDGSKSTNDSINKLIDLTKSVNPGVYYVGRSVEAEGNKTEIKNGYAPITFKTDKPADSVRVNVKDEQGKLVATINLSDVDGHKELVWDGTGSDGQRRTSGVYTFEVAAFKSGSPVTVKTYTSGVVDGAEFDGDKAQLTIGSLTVDSSKVVAVREQLGV
jgi:flagellar hook assembly protein FlgD